MARLCDNLARKEIPEKEQEEEFGSEYQNEVPKKEPDSENQTREALSCLSEALSPKEWSWVLKVSPEFIRMVMRGDKPLPQGWISKIAHGMRVHERRMRKLHDWAYDMLEMKYGPLHRSDDF